MLILKEWWHFQILTDDLWCNNSRDKWCFWTGFQLRVVKLEPNQLLTNNLHSQSQTAAVQNQNQSNYLIAFDIQLKTALYRKL